MLNPVLIVSGLLATFCAVGHLAIGGPRYLGPMMDATFDAVPKRVMQALFHYITVNFVVSALVLLAAGIGVTGGLDLSPVVLFVGIQFLLYTLVQLVIISVSVIPRGLIKMFQWTLFLLIGVTALVGAL